MKKVKQILYGNLVDMGGIPLRQPLPTQNVEQIDPFLLLHHARLVVKPDTNHKHAGVGPHPHRGFSPVTFVFEGSVHHRDSRGNSSVVSEGGVQWMNAGMGMIHSERPSEELAREGGYQEIIQLWVNTPAAHKMDQPYYLALQKGEIPRIDPDKGEGYIQLVSGEMNGKQGKVKTQIPLLSAMGKLHSGAEHIFHVPADRNTTLYLLDGELSISGHGLVEKHQLIVFDNEGTDIGVIVKKDTRFLLLSGEPINEPLATHGPFVMNNQTQIMEAMRDYQMGKMGMLVEEF